MRRDYSGSEVRALILDWLERHGRWGAHYFPLDTIVNKLSHVVKNNGRMIKKAVKELANEGYVLPHKGGGAISLNPARKSVIVDHIKEVLKI
ncbi:MAG: hypothetical protein FJZ49_04240 [Candidatus Verstraetearchaeota archaeon]|nr:hypothetical protein [Candidatus Verstraetearchaeota archaeon]